jgi:hypothetical protein
MLDKPVSVCQIEVSLDGCSPGSTVVEHLNHNSKVTEGNTKGGSIIVPLTSCLTGLD